MPARMHISKRPTREQLEELYVSREIGVRGVAMQLGVSPAFVRKELRRHGIDLRPVGLQKHAHVDVRTADTYQRLYHDEHKSLRKVARELDVSTDVVLKDMQRFGIATRPISPTPEEYAAREQLGMHDEPTTDRWYERENPATDRSTDGKVRHRDLDTTFFESIDSEVKAYALGLLWADGSISAKGWTTRIKLEKGDSLTLEVIRAAMRAAPIVHSEPNVKSGGKTPMALLQINCKEIVQQLQRQGLCDNKAARLPRVLPPPLQFERAFVRGLIDGDGTLYMQSGPTISFANMNPWLRKIVIDCWERITGKHPPTYASITEGKPRGRVSEIGERAQAIAHALYLDGATVYLSRKKERAEQFQLWVSGAKKKLGT